MRSALFRRTEKSETAPAVEPKPDGKGRPTPSRKEAEAAAKERARAVMDKDAAKKLLRERRVEGNKQMREGMRAGEERFLPERDKGPVKRFIRDWVDSRLTFTEFLLPLLVLIMVLSVLGRHNQKSGPALLANYLWSASVLLLIVDVMITRFRLRRALKRKFPEENLRGTTFYAFLRVLQLRPMRIPKTQVKVGQHPE